MKEGMPMASIGAILARAGAVDGTPIRGKFSASIACNDDQLLVVSQAQPDEEERKGHTVEVRENSSKRWPITSGRKKGLADMMAVKRVSDWWLEREVKGSSKGCLEKKENEKGGRREKEWCDKMMEDSFRFGNPDYIVFREIKKKIDFSSQVVFPIKSHFKLTR